MPFSNYQIGFNQPGYWALWLLVPCLWWWSFQSLASLGRIRRFIILLLQTAVVTLLIAALAEVQWQRINDRVTVIYLLDQSESIPTVQREAMIRYVAEEVKRHRNDQRRDRAGVIIFGRDPAIEIPPFEASIPNLKLESSFDIRTDATNLAAALKMAQAMFAEDSAKRVVVVSDGNENMGDAKSVAATLADNGIGIDVVPIELTKGNEVAVERVVVPNDARQGQPTEVRVVVNNYGHVTADNPTGETKGSLRISRAHDGEEELLSSEEVTLVPGKNVYRLSKEIEKTGSYFYRAEFVPETGTGDSLKQNNIATGFTQVRGKGRVLFIENHEKKGEYDFLVDRLQKMNLEVKKVNSSNAFNSLAELQGYDTVVMANVPRAGGDLVAADSAVGFTDEQVLMLVHNVEQLGCGLVMLGGENSFGCGGWAGTELEKIMPVDFQIKNAAVKPNGALVLLMHASELAQGNHWQKVVGHKAVKMLGPTDYCGVLHWDNFVGGDKWLWSNGLVQVGTNQTSMLAKIDKMVPGDMPDFDPALNKALTAFQGLTGKTAVKHMIVISDGDPAPPGPGMINKFKAAGVTVSTVAIGTHGPAGSGLMQSIASGTGGKYYVVSNAAALPSIYINEVKKIAKPLIYESVGKPFRPQITYPHEMLGGIEGDLPPLTGFVLTTKKEHPLVEVSMLSPVPDGGGENGTILASWNYKAGRTVAFTTDAGHRWANDWQKWANYDKLFSQMVRWSMRPVNEQGKFTLSTDIKDGRVRVVVTALDKEDNFLNFLSMAGTASSPDPKKPALNIDMRQDSPGRYVGEFPADEAGSYFIAVSPGKDYGGPLLAGVTVPYSAEFRERETNHALLEMLSKYKPQGGEIGQIVNVSLTSPKLDEPTAVDTFRATLAKAFSSQDAWPLAALLAAGCFLVSIAVRRISIDPEWFTPAMRWMRRLISRQEEPVPADARLERLRSRKAEVTGQLDERRAATRFEIPAGEQAAETSLADAMRESVSNTEPTDRRPTTTTPEAIEEESYTDRLLKAKRRAQQNRDE
jgi:uncharacterized membrane protein/Mg-chelatase subunit ChlD